MAEALSYSGRYDEAIDNANLALRLNPLDPANFFRFVTIARACFCLGQYPEAIAWAKKTIQRRPVFHEGHIILIVSLVAQDDLDGASKALTKYLRMFPEVTVASLAELGTTSVQLQGQDRDMVFNLLGKAGMA